MICVDACFLNCEFGGQLDAIVGWDGNNDMFPIAFVVCKFETRET